MNFMAYTSLVIAVLLVGALACMECGRWLGARRLARDPEAVKSGAGAVDAAVFALMGLLLAFAFSGAAARFDVRRATIVEEANAIGTAWLRLDLLPASAQPALRGKLRQYADARISASQKVHDLAAAREARIFSCSASISTARKVRICSCSWRFQSTRVRWETLRRSAMRARLQPLARSSRN
jgi:hypothetical protein